MGAPRVTLEVFLERSKAIHGEKYDYSKVNWVDTHTKVEIVCPKHGSFFQTPFKHMQKQGCPACRKNATVTQEAFIKRAKQIHGNKYDYSRVDYVNMRTPVEIICPEHGSFFQIPAKHIKRGKCSAQGCPKCRYIRQKDTLQSRYGIDNPMKKKEFADTNWETKKKKGTCNSSKPEDQMYKELVEFFGKTNVKRNYNKDERYPFYCDFYIVSQDMFIELNGTWFHGEHFFDKHSKEDVETLRLWEERAESGRTAYKEAIYRWTVDDLNKRNTAEMNDLNYLVFWDSDLTDFRIWLKNFTETNRTT